MFLMSHKKLARVNKTHVIRAHSHMRKKDLLARKVGGNVEFKFFSFAKKKIQ